jgi:putative oxidoreductase
VNAVTCQNLTALFGRIFLSAIFLVSALGKVMDWSGTTQHMAEKGMTATSVFLAGALVLELFGGLSVLLGLFTRWGAAALVVFLVCVTPVFHNFWVEDGAARMNQMQHFMKNAALLGGLLVLAAFGPGGFSLDSRWRAVRAERPVWEKRGQSVTVG